MPVLQSHPSLGAVQEYVRRLEQERGFAGNSVQDQCLLLGEEVGELYKATRKKSQMPVDEKSAIGTVDEELADILIYVCSIANRFGIDLERALRDKEEINKRRRWQPDHSA